MCDHYLKKKKHQETCIHELLTLMQYFRASSPIRTASPTRRNLWTTLMHETSVLRLAAVNAGILTGKTYQIVIKLDGALNEFTMEKQNQFLDDVARELRVNSTDVSVTGTRQGLIVSLDVKIGPEYELKREIIEDLKSKLLAGFVCQEADFIADRPTISNATKLGSESKFLNYRFHGEVGTGLGNDSSGPDSLQVPVAFSSPTSLVDAHAFNAAFDILEYEQDDPDRLDKWAILADLSHNLVSQVISIGRIILSEHHLLPNERTIKPIPDTDTYVHQGVVFKVASDMRLPAATPTFLYGGRSPQIDFASKAAGNAFRNSQVMFDSCMDYLNSHPDAKFRARVPMTILLDFLGLRLIAHPLPQLEPNPVYGLNDDGSQVNTDTETHAWLLHAANKLHLAPHESDGILVAISADMQCKVTKSSPKLVQESEPRPPVVNETHDGWLLNLGRCMPPEAPINVPHLPKYGQTIFYRLLRPEFLQTCKQARLPALSADAFSGFGVNNSSELNAHVRLATQYLIQKIIPAFASKLVSNPSATKDRHLIVWSQAMHTAGINMRHLGLIRSLVLKFEPDIVVAGDYREVCGNCASRSVKPVSQASGECDMCGNAQTISSHLEVSSATAAEVTSEVEKVQASLLCEMLARTLKAKARTWLRDPHGSERYSVANVGCAGVSERVLIFLNLCSGVQDSLGFWEEVETLFSKFKFVLAACTVIFPLMYQDFLSRCWIYSVASSVVLQ